MRSILVGKFSNYTLKHELKHNNGAGHIKMIKEWKNGMPIVGLPEILGNLDIDSDHRKVSDALDALLLSLTYNANHNTVLSTLVELIDSICRHFQTEEYMMLSIKYDAIDAHKKEHEEFMNLLWSILFNFETNNEQITTDTLTMISFWKFDHISTFDKEFVEAYQYYLRNN